MTTENNETVDFAGIQTSLKACFGVDLKDLTWQQMVSYIEALPKPEAQAVDHRTYVEAMRKKIDHGS